ncbi:MAG: hypothetical protein V1861_01295 [Candidatus Micrarchaeota archaeon]
MKGFVLTIVSLLFLSLIFTMATTLHNHYLSMERSLAVPQPLSYASYSIGSAAVSLNSILGPDLSLNADNATLDMAIIDTVPMRNVSGELSDYSALLQGGLANQTHASIAANLSNVSDGSYSLLINRRYTYSNAMDGEMVFSAVSGGTNASEYEVTISVLQERMNITHFNFSASGDINLTLTYTDRNGTIIEQGTVSSSSVDRFQVIYAGGGSLEVGVGRASAHDGSLWVTAQDIVAETGIHAVLPPPSENDRVGYEYDVPMDYRIGGAEVSRRIGT